MGFRLHTKCLLTAAIEAIRLETLVGFRAVYCFPQLIQVADGVANGLIVLGVEKHEVLDDEDRKGFS